MTEVVFQRFGNSHGGRISECQIAIINAGQDIHSILVAEGIMIFEQVPVHARRIDAKLTDTTNQHFIFTVIVNEFGDSSSLIGYDRCVDLVDDAMQ